MSNLCKNVLPSGSWLAVNGGAVYNSKPWTFQNDSTNGDVWYTQSDDEQMVFAFVQHWPENDLLVVTSPIPDVNATSISLLGLEGQTLEFSYDVPTSSLAIHFPSMSRFFQECHSGFDCRHTYVLAMTNIQSESPKL